MYKCTLLLNMQMYPSSLMKVCQWWHWMKQAKSESLGAHQHWFQVKWSLVTLCSTGEMELPLTPNAQCLDLIQPHTPSPTSILVHCMKWELHQWALLDWVDTAVGVGSKLQPTTVSVQCMQGSTIHGLEKLIYGRCHKLLEFFRRNPWFAITEFGECSRNFPLSVGTHSANWRRERTNCRTLSSEYGCLA